MTREIDYESVEIPDEKAPSEYSYAERRAEILERIKEAGHPRLVNQAEIADEFGCTRQNIHKDMNALAEFVDETLGDRRELTTQAVLERSITGFLADKEWRQAAKTALELERYDGGRRNGFTG